MSMSMTELEALLTMLGFDVVDRKVFFCSGRRTNGGTQVSRFSWSCPPRSPYRSAHLPRRGLRVTRPYACLFSGQPYMALRCSRRCSR